ncbi:cell envelope integrity TolA C-terminal domain-containing protein [Pantoea anthophila]|uniref:cell envelope integrity TolA C-terminal domain-containing protein n=1 Tax=Pantoea anthophila TaxID=470931 RepID=UPI00301D82B0
MKKIILILLSAAIVSCTPLKPHECDKSRALDSCRYNRSGKVGDNDIYGKQASGIKKALDAALSQPHAWNGKRCNAHLDFRKDGTLEHFIIKGGDKAYCNALREAAKNARFPEFTDQHVFDVMGSARWNMEGQP